MSEDSSTDQPALNEQPGASPVPGCIILVTVVVMFVGLAVLYISVFSLQKKEVAGFTDPQPVERAVLEPTAEQVAAADGKIARLEALAVTNEMDQLKITADDLNVWIATRELLADFRGNTFVSAISEKGIAVEMSQAMRKALFSKERQYLNGTFYLVPQAMKESVVLKVVDIDPDSGEPLDPKFIDAYSQMDFFRIDTSNPDLAPALNQIGKIYLQDGEIVVETRIDMDRVKSEQ